MFSPTSKGSPGKSPKALPVNDGAASTGEAGTRSVPDASGTAIQPGSPFSRHAANAKADAVIDVSATPRCWTPGQMVADGKQPPANPVIKSEYTHGWYTIGKTVGGICSSPAPVICGEPHWL